MRCAQWTNKRLKGMVDASEVIHKAFVKLDQQFGRGAGNTSFTDRKEFRGYVPTAMQNILIDMAREGGKDQPRRSQMITRRTARDAAMERRVVDVLHLRSELEKIKEECGQEHYDALVRHYVGGETLPDIAASMLGEDGEPVSRATAVRRLKG